MTIHAIHHVVLTISDFDQTLKFYRDLLGFEVEEVKWEGGQMLFFKVGDATVWFLKHGETAPNDRFSETRIGLDHLSFKVDSLEELQALADKLVAAGVNTKGVEQFMGGNNYMALRDPDNIQLEYWLD